jgi:hypothetical protein
MRIGASVVTGSDCIPHRREEWADHHLPALPDQFLCPLHSGMQSLPNGQRSSKNGQKQSIAGNDAMTGSKPIAAAQRLADPRIACAPSDKGKSFFMLLRD